MNHARAPKNKNREEQSSSSLVVLLRESLKREAEEHQRRAKKKRQEAEWEENKATEKFHEIMKLRNVLRQVDQRSLVEYVEIPVRTCQPATPPSSSITDDASYQTQGTDPSSPMRNHQGSSSGVDLDQFGGLVDSDTFMYAPTLSDSRGVVFVYEIHTNARRHPKGRLSRKLDQDRWKSAQWVYIVMMGNYQLGLACRLDNVPHYQVSMGEVQEFLQKLTKNSNTSFCKKKLKILGPAGMIIDEYFAIKNSATEIFQNDWDSARQLLERKASRHNTANTGQQRRQRSFEDVGFTGGQSLSRENGCPWGIARPNLKPLTRTKHGLAVMRNTNCIREAVDINFPGIQTPPDPMHQTDFMTMHGGCVHSSRVAITDETSQCEAHCDTENGDGQVTWAAMLQSHQRLVQICYPRKAIKEYYARLSRALPYLAPCKEVLSYIPKQRVALSFESVWFDGEHLPLEQSLGLPLKKIPCTMEVSSYYQPFLSSMYRLFANFETDLEGAWSILCAMGTFSHCGLYPLIAAEILIHFKGSMKKDMDLGFELLVVMDFLEREEILDRFGKPFRFKRYRKVNCRRSRSEWKESVKRLTEVASLVNETEPSGLTQEHYDQIFKKFSESKFYQIGPLKINHVIGIASFAGLLSLPLYSFTKGGAAKFHNKLAGKCIAELPDETTVMSSLGSMIRAMSDPQAQGQKFLPQSCHVSSRYVENVACKIGRFWSGSDGHFVDIVDLDFVCVAVRRLTTRKIGRIILESENEKRDIGPMFFVIGSSQVQVNPEWDELCGTFAGPDCRLNKDAVKRIGWMDPKIG